MRHLTFIAFILLLVCHFVGVSQPCLPDGITFTTQSQVDSFPILYPNCTETEGQVFISGDDITNLQGLSSLVSILGEFHIVHNPVLETLSGLENLTSVGAWMRLSHNNSLTSINGLTKLEARRFQAISKRKRLPVNTFSIRAIRNSAMYDLKLKEQAHFPNGMHQRVSQVGFLWMRSPFIS